MIDEFKEVSAGPPELSEFEICTPGGYWSQEEGDRINKSISDIYKNAYIADFGKSTSNRSTSSRWIGVSGKSEQLSHLPQ